MSSRAKTAVVMNDGKPELTPKLRFPEFRNGPSWASKPMGEAYSFKGNNSLSRDQLNYEHGSVKNIHYGDIHTKFSTLFDITKETVPFINSSESLDGLRPENYCVEGDMIFADASEDLEEIGKSIELVRLNGERVVSGQHTILARPNDDSLVIGFGAYLFNSRCVRTQIQRESQGSKVLGVSATRLTKIELPIPSTKAEQKKVADCLSSLDELIAAQALKVEALRTHKKGLMQQLLPREGETQPRLRFPEFQKDPEWEMKTGGELFKNRKEDGEEWLPIYSVTVNDGMVPRASFDRNFYDIEEPTGNKKVCKGDIAYNTMRMWQGAQGVAAKDCIVSPAYVVLAPQSGVCSYFFAYLFKLPQSLRLLTGTSRGLTKDRLRLYFDDFALMRLSVPAFAEQQRIGSCLSSLDQLIAVQRHKLEALKMHKRGVMQRLFPETGASQDLSIETAIVVNVATASKRVEPEEALSQKPYKVGFARQLLAAEILLHCHHHPTMGRVKLQKIIHLCEYHAELDDIHGNYVRAAAGPFDNKLMRGVANGLEKQKWFKQVRGEKRVTYEPMVSSGQHAKYLERWSKQLPKIREIIRHFLKAKTLSCEIASTLYAAWNDLLIEGQQPTDEEIIREASDPKRWHESKANIDEVKWPAALNWMREKGLVPRGYGAHTTR